MSSQDRLLELRAELLDIQDRLERLKADPAGIDGTELVEQANRVNFVEGQILAECLRAGFWPL